MLKTIRSFDELAPNRNNNSKSTSIRNNDNKPAFKKNNGNSEVNEFSIGRNSMEHTKKSKKIVYIRKIKRKKNV